MLIACNKLWINNKSLPIFPLIDDKWLTPDFLEAPILIIYGILHFLALFKPKKIFIWLIILIYIALILNDQNRIITYHYQVIIVLLLFLFNSPIYFYKGLFIGIYFWGGIHKFNPCFFNYFSNQHLFGLPDFLKFVLAISIPTIETLLALGLIFRLTKKYAFLGLVSMHLLILISVFLFFKSYNIIPWNIINCLILFHLFWKNSKVHFTIENSKIGMPSLILAITIFAGPLCNKANLWDEFLAFKMYTYDVNQFYYEVSDKVKTSLPIEIHQSYRKNKNGKTLFYLYDWFYRINGVPMYPEERNIIRIEQYLEGYLPSGALFSEELILKNYSYCE
ncbi:hypothetical protein RBH94_09880 [Aestuariibaculum sp. YM273]|uniref:MauE/DoxX family redox-associated membrane protein n=1 Tax=Aestuariibaculum sp. YM273 TaxID=3070659 RepID=UPI0027DAC7E6|nr:MauE/DoxX family redox-associated membrane protein [Aestuariibaculum sp. YM273]WMI64370.1 hypothetical protein RBH94_09880 [Aestuariibaculum sp. YM273]